MWKLRANSPTGWNRHLTLGLVLLMAASATPLLGGMPRGERHESRHEIDQLEDAWRDAVLRRDAAVLGSLLADDYMGITASGTLQSKDQTLVNIRAGDVHFNSMEVSDRKVRFYGMTALVISRVEISATTASGDISGSYRYTHVWVRDEKGVWKIVSFEASRIREHR
jgi:ketosteroid isomerase-like protein